MTRAAHPSTATTTAPDSAASAVADYRRTIRVRAGADAAFDALTTPAGLAAWWNPATGDGETGGELRFVMNDPEPLVIHVDEATRPTSVRWTVTSCPFLTEWVGTQPTFTITSLDAGTIDLTFHHRGLHQDLDCIDMCTRSWNHYVASLRDHLEHGTGSPYLSPADVARRQAEGRTTEPHRPTGTSIHQEAIIPAPPSRVFELLTDSHLFAAATGQPARVTACEGDTFSLFTGRVEGRHVELVPGRRVVQAWRFGTGHPTAWEPGVYSTVRFTLEPVGSRTRLVIDHTGIPAEWTEHIASGYPTFYADPIATYFAHQAT